MYYSSTDITSRKACSNYPLFGNRQFSGIFVNYNVHYFICHACLQVSLSFSFRMGRSTVSTVIKETCEVISRVLANEFVKPPQCASEWEGISKEFYQRWNFPNCVGMY